MLKLTDSNLWRFSRVFRVLYSTEAQSSSSSSSSSSTGEKTMISRVLDCRDGNSTITPVLDQWLGEGREIQENQLNGLIKLLRKHNRFSHAIELKDWMTNKMNFELTSGGMAIKLDLISKAHGLNKAEEYFNSVPVSLRDRSVHGALLGCYAEKKMLVKAEELFQKMKDLGFTLAAYNYNIMLTMYTKMGKHEKFNALLEEMKKNGIEGDSRTCHIQLNVYANSNLEKMGELLSNITADGSQVTLDFHGYLIAAKAYLKGGKPEKAIIMLTKAEEQSHSQGNIYDFNHLITLYGEVGRKADVHRVWNLYKTKRRVDIIGYRCVLNSLSKLKDFDGVEKIFGEWESETKGFDDQITNLLIHMDCENGHIGKALARVERFTSQGHKLNAAIWQYLATQWCEDGQVSKAVEPMKKAILVGGHNWKLNRITFDACLKYLKNEGNLDLAHELLGLLKERGKLADHVFDQLSAFVNKGKGNEPLPSIGIIDF